MIYIAGPIDYLEVGQVRTYYDLVRSTIRIALGDVVAYFPLDAFQMAAASRMPDTTIRSINDTVLEQADAVLAWLPPDVVTYGTPIEIDRARRMGIPVAIYNEGAELTSPMFAGVEQFDNVHKALTWLAACETPIKRSAMRIKYTHQKAQSPQRSHLDDAGFDLFVCEQRVIPARQFTDVPCGLAVELPLHHWGMIVGRSSTFRRHRLRVEMGIIDCGFRGELFVGVHNMNEEPHVVREGDRIAQLIPFEHVGRNWWGMSVEQLSESSRGEAGFGSTGS